jgi:hypothetical protein
MENNLNNQLENMKTPEANNVKHQEVYKMVLTNAKKSSRIGIVFILIPLLFVLIASLKMFFFMQIDFHATMDAVAVDTAKFGALKWILPVVFLGLPILAIIINLLAISHFNVDKEKKELVISIRYRLKNIIVLIISVLIVIAFFVFVIIAYTHFK